MSPEMLDLYEETWHDVYPAKQLRIRFSKKSGRICSPFGAITENGVAELFFLVKKHQLSKFMRERT